MWPWPGCWVVSGFGLSVCGIIQIRLHVTFRGVYQRDTTQMAPCCLLVPILNLQQEDELTLRRLWWFARCRHMDYKCTVFLNNPNNHLMRSALLSLPCSRRGNKSRTLKCFSEIPQLVRGGKILILRILLPLLGKRSDWHVLCLEFPFAQSADPE